MQFVPLVDASPAVKAHVRTLRNQEDVRKHMYTSHEISEKEHEGWLNSLKGNDRQAVFVAIRNGLALGIASLNSINALQKTADWAFYLDTEIQGQGLGSILEFWVLDYAFNNAGLDKLNCEVLETNPAVIKMHQKFGFELEGVRRKNILKDGRRIDVVLLGITKEEWKSKRPLLEPLILRLNTRTNTPSY